MGGQTGGPETNLPWSHLTTSPPTPVSLQCEVYMEAGVPVPETLQQHCCGTWKHADSLQGPRETGWSRTAQHNSLDVEAWNSSLWRVLGKARVLEDSLDKQGKPHRTSISKGGRKWHGDLILLAWELGLARRSRMAQGKGVCHL